MRDAYRPRRIDTGGELHVAYARGIMPLPARGGDGGRRYLAGFTTRQPGKNRAARPELLLAIVKLSTGIAPTSISSRVWMVAPQGNYGSRIYPFCEKKILWISIILIFQLGSIL